VVDYFPAFRELRKKVKAVDQYVLINTILKRPEYQKFITNYNTRVQLFELNEDSEGIKLSANRGGYADETLRLAAAGESGYTQAKRGRDRVDLNATGDHYESHSVEIVSLKADYFNMLSGWS